MKNPVMNSEGNQPVTRELPVSSAQLLYVVSGLICLQLLVQRFRNRRYHRKPTNASGRRITIMDSQKLLAERTGGKQTTGTVEADQLRHQQPQQPMSNSFSRDFSQETVAPLPSARDILHPLSHCTPLPSSGHLAAVLSQERRARGGPIRPLLPKSAASPEPKEEKTEKKAPLSPLPASPWPISTRTVMSGGSSPRPQGGGSEAKKTRRNPSPGDASPGLSEPVKGSEPNATSCPSSSSSSPPSTGTGTGEIPTAAATLGRRSSGLAAEKCDESVQHLRYEDESGTRKWRHYTVEYS